MTMLWSWFGYALVAVLFASAKPVACDASVIAVGLLSTVAAVAPLVLTVYRHTRPCLPSSLACTPPGLVKDRKRVTYSLVLSSVTAMPRGWKCRALSPTLQALLRISTLPMIWRVAVLSTVIVSWPLLATKTRWPSGEATTFHGSAPVISVFS